MRNNNNDINARKEFFIDKMMIKCTQTHSICVGLVMYTKNKKCVRERERIYQFNW